MADVDQNVLSLFNDDNPVEALQNFIENLNDDECSIIRDHGKDLRALKSLVDSTNLDVGETAKALHMEG